MAFSDLVAGIDRAILAHLGGETVTYQPKLGAPVDVTGVFDEQYFFPKNNAVWPAVFLRVEDLPVEPEGDEPTITVRGLDYRVVDREPGGNGMVVLGLRLVA